MITLDNLHENLCSGVLLSDLIRLLIPSAASKFSHFHVPALSKATALSNLEQVLGIILRSKAFVFSERIPKPLELLEACGSGDVGHLPQDAIMIEKKNLGKMLTLLDELFRAFIMKDFISFSVDVPTMVADNKQTTSSLAQRRRLSQIGTKSMDSSGMELTGDRYKSGLSGFHVNSGAITDSEIKSKKKDKKTKELAAAKAKAKAGTFGSGGDRRHSYINGINEKESEKHIMDEEAKLSAYVTKPSEGRRTSQASLEDIKLKHGNVPVPTSRLIDMLEWYQSIMKLYQRGFSPKLVKYIQYCRRNIDNKDVLKKINQEQGLPEAMEGIWGSMQSGVALFCIIMHFYGYGSVLDYDGNDTTSSNNSTKPNETAASDVSNSSKSTLRLSQHDMRASSSTLRIDPIFIYATPRTKSEHRSNIVYLFRLLSSVGIDSVWNANDWLYNPDPDFLILQLYDVYLSIGREGKAECVLPLKQGVGLKPTYTANKEPKENTASRIPFQSNDNDSESSGTDSSSDEEGGNYTVRLVVSDKKNPESLDGAYVEGIYFADDLGFGENGDNDIDLSLMDGFGGRFDMVSQKAEAAKAELEEETFVVMKGTGKELKRAAMPKQHDIQAAIDKRFNEALKRNIQVVFL